MNFKKILVVVVVLIAVIIVALGFFLKSFVTPERVKAFLHPQAEKALNRKVDIGEVSIGLFKGIEVRDFAIKEADEKTDFVACKEFVLKFKLLPLLSKRVIIDELKLVAPEIVLHRSGEGVFNFQDIGKKREPEESPEAKEAETEGLPISLLVNNILLKDARFSLVDLKKELPDLRGTADVDMGIRTAGKKEVFSKGKIDLRLDEMALRKPSEKRIQNLKSSLDYEAGIHLESNDISIRKADIVFQDIPASLSGEIRQVKTTPEIDLAVSLSKADTASILKAVRSFVDIEGVALSGGLTADLKIAGTPQKVETLKANGSVVLDNLDVTYKEMRALVDGSFKVKSNDISIERADVTYHNIPATLKGEITKLQTTPEIDLAVSVPKADAADLQKALASFKEIEGLALSGGLTADLKIAGTPQKADTLKTDGTVQLENVGVAYRNVNARLDGSLRFREQSVDIDLKNTIGKNSARLKGAVENYFKNQRIQLDLYSQQLFLDEVIPAGTSTSSAGGEVKAQPKSPPAEAKPLDLKLEAAGEIKIDAARYKDMDMKNFYARYQIRNNRVTIPKMTAEAGKGTINLESAVDLAKPGYAYELTCAVNSLHAEEIVNSFFPKAKDTIFGMITSRLQVKGSGTSQKSIQKNLQGKGDFTMTNGKITNSKIPEQLALFLGIPELRTIYLKQAKGTVDIGKGVALLKSIFSSDDLSLDPSGTIGLDKTLNLSFDLKMSPTLTRKVTLDSKVGQYIRDDKGWGTLPLKLSGTFSDPSYGIDLEKAGKRVIEKKGKELLDKIFDKGNEEQKEGEKKQPETKPVEELFKGLFR